MKEDSTLELAKALIALPSITPDDATCQELLSKRLQKNGFTIESFPFGNVKNLYARRGTTSPVFLFAGHTDVVPPGPLDKWTSPPFVPTLRDGYLYGRGAADMKSGMAAMMIASERFIQQHPHHEGSIAFLITSDEEGAATDGTKRVVEELLKRQEKIDWCVIGEASSEVSFGDIIKIGRRGSLSGHLIIKGKQGHIAYPQKADNPIPKSLLAIHELCSVVWDRPNDHFPATSFQISNLHAGIPTADNVIPGSLEVLFNFRFGTSVTAPQLQQRVHDILNKHGLTYDLTWHLSGEPFLSQKGDLYNAACQAIETITGKKPEASTGGGTSDGRFIIHLGCELLEIGPINQSIHQIDEHISIKDLNLLTTIYEDILGQLFRTK